jgi:hypothetical protein
MKGVEADSRGTSMNRAAGVAEEVQDEAPSASKPMSAREVNFIKQLLLTAFQIIQPSKIFWKNLVIFLQQDHARVLQLILNFHWKRIPILLVKVCIGKTKSPKRS